MPGTIVAMFLAVDADRQSDTSRIIYSLKSADSFAIGNDFVIDSEYGWLKIGTNGIDCERRGFYKLKIIASDENGLNVFQVVNVKIMDENDSPPLFDYAEYSTEFELTESLYSFQKDFIFIQFEEKVLQFTITVSFFNFLTVYY